MIYFVRCEQNRGSYKAGWIKIGVSSRLSVRLKQIAADIGHMPTVLGVLDGAYSEERAIHQRFALVRMVGEWFSPCDGLLQIIEIEARPWDGEDEKSPTGYVKLPEDLVRSAQIVAALCGVTVTDLLSDILEAVLEERLQECIAKRVRQKAEAKR